MKRLILLGLCLGLGSGVLLAQRKAAKKAVSSSTEALVVSKPQPALKSYSLVAKDEFGTVGLSGVMQRAEGARMAKGKALSAEMQTLFDSLQTPFEKSGGLATASYTECVTWYRRLAKAFPAYCALTSIGLGDAGKDIYVFKLLGERMGRMDRLGQSDDGIPAGPNQMASPKVKILINNNIHPGEPEGTDASMFLVRDLLFFGQYWQQTLPYLELHVVCQYNVDGTLNRNAHSRANQNGPVEYGFRGNAQNLDLNRDFIKMDSRNAKALVALMASEKYHLFVDNHTSNGADYQYVLTYFHTRPEKLMPEIVPNLLQLETGLKHQLARQDWPTAPYVETIKTVPDSGLFAFWESGRYATGFAALHNTIGYTVETHMLKPFSQRMLATLAFMEQFLTVSTSDSLRAQFEKNRMKGWVRRVADQPIHYLPIAHTLDLKQHEMIPFKGFEFGYRPSEITGADRLVYDTRKPWEKPVRYYNHYVPTDSVRVPRAYIIPFAYDDVIQKLKRNGIAVSNVPMDTLVSLRVSYIVDYKTVSHPYEKHYLHHSVKTRDTVMKVMVRAGDVVAVVKPDNERFLTAVLEPRAADSYFAWNSFDGILQQKEGYSDYVFEDKAAVWLKAHPDKYAELQRKKAQDPVFAKDAWAQLNWVYKQTEHYEPTHNLYPVYRVD
ncbi:MAG: M14 family zinc carboxypeptidase [Bacteroidia bacterium]